MVCWLQYPAGQRHDIVFFMGKRVDKSMPRVVREDSPESFGLEDFANNPDDQGLSLEELGDAYAALLGKGADPYAEPEQAGEGDDLAAEGETAEIAEPAYVPPPMRGADDEACEITPKSILEAILFVGHPQGEPLTSKQISGLMRGVMPSEVDDLVHELNDAYAATDAVYRINSVGAGYRLQLREEFGLLRDKFLGRVKEARLSQAALDILAIVAYQQPLGQAEIDRIRSKPSAGMLSQLVRRDLLQVERLGGKGTKPVYRTTTRFLDLFGLDSLADLPRSQESDRGL